MSVSSMISRVSAVVTVATEASDAAVGVAESFGVVGRSVDAPSAPPEDAAVPLSDPRRDLDIADDPPPLRM